MSNIKPIVFWLIVYSLILLAIINLAHVWFIIYLNTMKFSPCFVQACTTRRYDVETMGEWFRRQWKIRPFFVVPLLIFSSRRYTVVVFTLSPFRWANMVHCGCAEWYFCQAHLPPVEKDFVQVDSCKQSNHNLTNDASTVTNIKKR